MNSENSLFNDITPIEQFSDKIDILKLDDNSKSNQIMNYFRAILVKHEISERVYDFTEEVIKINPSNYIAWVIRRECIDQLENITFEKELMWLDNIMVKTAKCYQIWHHRKVLIDKYNDCSHEKDILQNVYESDTKNFHAWTHRIWMIRRFNNTEGEFEFIDKCLKEDIKNNSVWNYRFFLINYLYNKEEKNLNEVIIPKEIEYSLEKIKICPVNESVFCYLRGYIIKYNKKYLDYPLIKKTLLELCTEWNINHIFSMLLDIYEEEKNKEKCEECINKLIILDYIRKKYWNWRKVNLKI